MQAVGIRQLKNGLSRYLDRVRSGEVILVLDHDDVVAEIRRPTLAVPGRVSKWEAFLNEQEQTGGLVRARQKPSRSVAGRHRARPPKAALRWRAILAETRTDRP